MGDQLRLDNGGGYSVAFQGEKGAYSEQAIFELLGRTSIRAVPFSSFDAAFDACTAREVDLLMVPIENSLGGTIHANCDLQLQHSLFIIAEHNFRVRHSLLALPGTKVESLTKVISHPQALAQCDTFCKKRGLKAEAAYDTAGAAKLIAEGKLENVGAICSQLASQYYDVEVLMEGIEDDSGNYTRFLLLRSDPVRIPPGVPCKTSIVFSTQDLPGALFKAMSCFALRDIDLSKIESRPCKPDIMDRLERLFWSMNDQRGANYRLKVQQPGDVNSPGQPLKKARLTMENPGEHSFRYLFYLDILQAADEPNAGNALTHLREMSTFCRVLGSFPRGGKLKGLDNLGLHLEPVVDKHRVPKRRIGILGFSAFGQFIGKRLAADFHVFASTRSDQSVAAAECGVTWCTSMDEFLQQRLDVLIISVSILSFESVVRRLRDRILALGLERERLLVVDVLSVKVHAKSTMVNLLPESCDILCSHPMFGPESGKKSWKALPFVFERVRMHNAGLGEEFLRWWSCQGCRMVDMSCEQHDEYAASSQFVTHFTGRVLARLRLQSTPINTQGFESLLQLTENTCKAFQKAFAEVSAELQEQKKRTEG